MFPLQFSRSTEFSSAEWAGLFTYKTVCCNIPVHIIVNLYIAIPYLLVLFVLSVFVLSMSFCRTVGASVRKTNSSYV